ncbi:MAG: T9SS type A sorting domain-containing protein [Bacteroidales bacterium]|nr:T9SS type A sorting domain-containing protein [Bacteroidales bacterium]
MKHLLILLNVLITINLAAQISFSEVESADLNQMEHSNIEFGDYDGDGDLDVFVKGVIREDKSLTQKTYLYRNDGGGIYTDLYIPFSIAKFGNICWFDLDHDNDLDLLYSGGTSPNIYNRLYINDGLDHFISKNIDIEKEEFGYLVDINNDGLIDIITAKSGINIHLNTGDFQFELIDIDYPDNARSMKIAIGDYNNDAYPDIFVCGIVDDKLGSTVVNHLFKNDQTGLFIKMELETYPIACMNVQFEDFDSDGDLDIFYSGYDWENDNTKSIFYKNNGGDSFTLENTNLPDFSFSTSSFADVDNNGYVDLLLCAQYEGEESLDVHLVFNNGDWSFTENDSLAFYDDGSYNIKWGDVNNDGHLDIAATAWYSNILTTKIFTNNASTNPNTQPQPPLVNEPQLTENSLYLSWGEGSDAETNQAALTYNYFIKHDQTFLVSPSASIDNGKLFSTHKGNSKFLRNLNLNTELWDEGHYFFGVQTIDQGFQSSPFSELKQFTIYHSNLSDAPSNLTVTQNTSNEILLNWSDNSNDELAFHVQKRIGVNHYFETLIELPQNTETFIDIDITHGDSCFYRIMVGKAGGQPGFSDIIFIKAPFADIEAPELITVSKVSPTELTVNWEDHSENEYGFILERSHKDASNFVTIDTLDENSVEYFDSGLAPLNNYFYRLQAFNSDGNSAFSSIKHSTTPVQKFFNMETILYEAYPSEGMSWGDYDNDGLEDLFLSKSPPVLYKNLGGGNFSIVGDSEIDIGDDIYNTIHGVWGDYDNDSYLDLFISTENTPNFLFHNNQNGTFSKVETGDIVNTNKNSRGANWYDFDKDGDLDILITNSSDNELYRYDGGQVFTRIELNGSYNSYSSSWGDYNNDLLTDLIIGNGGEDDLFTYSDSLGFVEVITGSPTNDDHLSYTMSWGDYNNDLFDDLLVTSDDYINEKVYKNNNGESFSKLSNFHQNTSLFSGIRTGFWFDYDNDMDLDIYLLMNYYVVHSHRLYRNEGNDEFKFSLVEYEDGITSHYSGYGSLYDINDDGFRDVLMCSYSNQLMLNEGNGNNWIKIKLQGSPSNSFGVGAKVMVKAKDTWQMHTLKTQDAYRAQNGNTFHFGLSNSSTVDSIVIIWPMGTIQYLTDVDANQSITILEQEAIVKPLYKPSNLRADYSGIGVQLIWSDNSDNEDHFVLERSDNDGGGFYQIALLDPNTTTYNNEDVELYQSLSYRLKAVKENEHSAYTNTCEIYSSIFSEHKGFADLSSEDTKCIAFADYNNDGYLDVFVGNNDAKDFLYKNKDNVSFTSHESIISSEELNTNSAAWIDYNLDGNMDLFTASGGDYWESGKNKLFVSDGTGHFQAFESGDIVNEENESVSSAWADIDNDGFVDVYVANYNNKSMLYKNKGNGVFEKLSNHPMCDESVRYAMWSDFDRDEDQDLFVIDQNNQLKIYRNYGTGDFEELSLQELGIPYLSDLKCLNIEDFNNDHLLDLHLVSNGNNRIFKGLSNGFKEVSYGPLGFTNDNTKSSICSDINNDGLMDIFIINSDSNLIYLNNGNFSFTKFDQEAFSYMEESASRAAFGDVDGDGDEDLFIAYKDEPNKCYTNQGSGKNWVSIKLESTQGKNIIGAKVEIFTNRGVQLREIRSNSGVGAQNEMIAHFGLGNQTEVDFIKVTSPTGLSSYFGDIIVGEINHINADALGIKDISSSLSHIYPNPATTLIHIQITGNKTLDHIRLISISGKMVRQMKPPHSNICSLSVEDLQAGIYLLELQFEDEVRYEKVIIN